MKIFSTPSGLVLVHPRASQIIKDLSLYDVSVSYEGLGSPVSATGIFEWVAEEIERVLQADWGRYLSSGTSSANQTIMHFLRRIKRRKILLQDSSHKSILEAIAVFGGLEIEFIDVNLIPEFDAVMPPTVTQIEEAIKKNRDAQAIILASPAYDLAYYKDYRKIADIAHDNGMLLIVDAAWDHPPNLSRILIEGADIVVNSAHKMVGALQGASMIGIRDHGMLKRREFEILEECWKISLGTSPSYPIIISIGATLEILRKEPQLLDLPGRFIRELGEKLEKAGIKTLNRSILPKQLKRELKLDGWKLHAKTTISGNKIKRKCEEKFDIVLEKAGPNHVQLIGTFREILKKDIKELAREVSNAIINSHYC